PIKDSNIRPLIQFLTGPHDIGEVKMMNPVEKYFQALKDIRATGAGVPETSYYGALENLLNDIGSTLKPKVRCVISIANRGAGSPDGGLFTASQFRKIPGRESAGGQTPE